MATTKIEAVLFTHCRQFSPRLFHPKGEQISFCTALKYLGLWFDGKLTFKEHVKRTAVKTETVITSLSQLMSNLRGPSGGKHKLLANVAMLFLLYGVPIWVDIINAREYRRTEMILVQWKAVIRCVSGYRTASTEAVCVLAGITRSK